jgi:hypothetical protein
MLAKNKDSTTQDNTDLKKMASKMKAMLETK